MSYNIYFVYKMKDKFLAADIFDGRLERFGLKERQQECVKEWSARRRLVSDGEDELAVEVELDGSIEYVAYGWWSRSGQGYHPDVLEKLVKALNTEAEAVYCSGEDDLQLLFYCDEHGIDSGLAYDQDDPLRHEKWIEWKRSGRYAEAEAAATAHAK